MELEEIYSDIEARREKLESELNKLTNGIKAYSNWAWFFVYLGFFVAAIGLTCFFFPKISGKLNLNELGDYFAGSVASVWSLAGLFLIYVAFLGQKQQLIHQQIEILFSQAEVKATRIELKGQKDQLIQQNNTLKLQRFENTFFQLLKVYQSIVESFNNEGTGKAYFIDLQKRLSSSFTFKENADFINEHKNAVAAYKEFYFTNKDNLAYYLRSLYRIFRFIQQGDLSHNQKMVYAKIIRAQLSDGELYILYYNCETEKGHKFKPIIKEFNLLKHLPGFEKMEYSSINSKGFYATTPIDDETNKRRKFYNIISSLVINLVKNKESVSIKHSSPDVIFESWFKDNEYYISVDIGFEYGDDGYLKSGFGGEYLGKEVISDYVKNIIIEILILNQLSIVYSENNIVIKNSIGTGEKYKEAKVIIQFHHTDTLELNLWNDDEK